jgi:hypothetical protein
MQSEQLRSSWNISFKDNVAEDEHRDGPIYSVDFFIFPITVL